MKKISLLILIVTFASIGYSFSLPQPKLDKPKNDTTEIIRLCIYKALDSSRIPVLNASTKKYKFGDSILLTAENVSLQYLPTEVNAAKFKILSLKNICSILLAEPDIGQRPNYLTIRYFEKKAKSFYVIIECLSCGKYPSGGGLGMTIKKENGFLKITHIGGFSIN